MFVKHYEKKIEKGPGTETFALPIKKSANTGS